MPAHSKGLTERRTFRHTKDEGAIIANVVRVHAEAGIKISENDALRVLVRRGATPLPDTADAAREQMRAHWKACKSCVDLTPGCPDGWWLQDVYVRLRDATPPPPAPTATPPAAAPETPRKPRRTISGRRPLLPPAPGQTA